jgi:long-chain fatty acid transport protein
LKYLIKECGVKNRHKPLRTIVNAAVVTVITTSAAHAGAFSLYTESSAAAIGNYAAGTAAEAADASIGWYNPAGLTLIKEQQVVFGGVGVFPASKISGTSTFTAAPAPYIQSFSNIDGAENAFVPSAHYALPLGDKATFGFSVVAPFGLSTDWGVDSPVRYQATFTELITSNFSPELGAKLSDNFAVGAGLDLQYARVKFNRMLGLPTILQALTDPPAGLDSLSYNKGNSFGVGYHVGLMGMFNDKHSRVGINYQSKMRHTFNGYSQLSGPLANGGNIFDPTLAFSVRRNNNLSSNPIELPDVVTLSGYHDLNENFALLGSVVYTGWSSFKTIQLNNVAAPSFDGGGNITSVIVNSASPQNYKDVWRVAVGANYHLNTMWMLRVGGGYDQSPLNNVYRDVRLPDADRWALSVGTHYQARPNLGIDVGYTHLFGANEPTINRTDVLSRTATSTSSYNVNATVNANADLVGAQVVWAIDGPAATA